MEVLKWLALGAVLVFAVIAAYRLLKWSVVMGWDLLKFLSTLVPALAGLGGAAWLWKLGHDNYAVIAVIVGFVAQWGWWRLVANKILGISESSGAYDDDWRSGKAATYDTKGNVTGYIDK